MWGKGGEAMANNGDWSLGTIVVGDCFLGTMLFSDWSLGKW